MAGAPTLAFVTTSAPRWGSVTIDCLAVLHTSASGTIVQLRQQPSQFRLLARRENPQKVVLDALHHHVHLCEDIAPAGCEADNDDTAMRGVRASRYQADLFESSHGVGDVPTIKRHRASDLRLALLTGLGQADKHAVLIAGVPSLSESLIKQAMRSCRSLREQPRRQARKPTRFDHALHTPVNLVTPTLL